MSVPIVQVAAGPPVALTLEPSQAARSERLAVTNAAAPAARLLLAGAALQLRDAHGNAAAAPGMRVRLALAWADQPGGPGLFLHPWLAPLCLAGLAAQGACLKKPQKSATSQNLSSAASTLLHA